MAGLVKRDVRSGHWQILAAILVVAILLRVAALDAYGLWTDEALTIVLSNWSVSDMLLLPTDPTPALYYIIHKLLIPANAPLEAVRSISVVAGVLSVGLIYLVGRLAFGAAGGLLAAALLAVWSAHVDYSQEARAYSLLFLLTLLPSLGLLYYARVLRQAAVQPDRSNDRRRRLALAVFCVGNVLSFYTHLIATVWIVLTSLLLLAIVRREWRVRRIELLAVFGAMTVGAIPGIYRLIQQVRVGDDFHWLGQAGLIDFADTSAAVLLPGGLWDNPLAAALGAAGITEAAVAAGSVALLGAGCWFGRKQLYRSLRAQPIVLWLILAYLMVPLIVWLFGFIARPLFMDRTILFAVPGMILLITAVCLALRRRIAARAAIGVVLAYCVSTLLFGIVREKEDWRGAYAYLSAVVSPTDIVAICPLYNYPALRYHTASPVGSAVLGMTLDGRLLVVERGLGTNANWDSTYFRHVWAPGTKGLRAPLPQLPPAGLSLRPGQSIWRVDGHCNRRFSAEMDAILGVASRDPGIAWSQKRKDPRTIGITIRRYRVVAPVAFNVRDLVAQPRGAPPFLSSARTP
jgi:mannosyltransferase